MILQEDILNVLKQMSGIYLLMWLLFIILAVVMIRNAKNLQPEPLLPLLVAALSVMVGLRMAFIWFGLNLDLPGYLAFPSYWKRIMDPSVIRPIKFIFPALVIHGLVYAFSELRRLSTKPGSVTRTTRLSVHLILSLTILTFAVHALGYRATLQKQKEELSNYSGLERIRFQYHPQEGDTSHDAYMIFVPREPWGPH